MIYHQLFIIFSSTIYFVSASEFSLKKPSAWTIIKRQIFGAPPVYTEVGSATFNPLLASLNRESKRSSLDSLADNVLHIILQNFIDDYTNMRLVSKNFRKAFDDLIYVSCWMRFPFFTKETFSPWNHEYLKYQLIPLVRLLSFNIEKLIYCYEKSEPRLDLTTSDHLRLNAVQLIRLVIPTFMDTCCELANIFLKLKFVAWNDICQFLFFDKSFSIYCSWRLGLTTIAREMSIYHTKKFIASVGPGLDGLLTVLRARKYHLARFIICFLRDRSHKFRNEEDEETFVNYAIAELVLAKYWDLLEEMYEICKEFVKSVHVLYLAYYGYVGGLRAFKDLAKRKSHKLAYLAASRGHLEFLQELHAMGLLGRSCYLSIYAASSNGHTECLDFLVSRLGNHYNLMDPNLARRSENLEMLRETLFSKVAPYYQLLVNG